MGNKKLWMIIGLLLIAGIVFSQTEADFNVNLTEDGTGVIIAGYTGRATRVQIPATIQGMPVREISGWIFSNGRSAVNNTITSVNIPIGVNIIREEAFMYCQKLTSVIIPEGITEIRDKAFYGTALTAVVLPQSLKIMGYGVFANTKISAIRLPVGVKIESDEHYYDDEGTFQRCTNLKSVVIPEGITEIADSMFGLCTSLTTIALPSSITKIGTWSFSQCSALTSITIPASVQSITFADNTFEGCPKLNLASQALLKKMGYQGTF